MVQNESTGELNLRYRMDILGRKLRRACRARLPARFLGVVNSARDKRRRFDSAFQTLLGPTFPWMSPNVWTEIVNFYRAIEAPRILEFGTGASTIWHARQIADLGQGVYTGIENDPDWFWIVVAGVMRDLGIRPGQLITASAQSRLPKKVDTDVTINLENARLVLRLRPSLPGYVEVFEHPQDVIIVDGMARRQCLQQVLRTRPFRGRALLMLMEAGRGARSWWEGPLQGEDDYSPELTLLQQLGGQLLNGDGVDTWPGCPRRSPRPISYYYPMEACKVIFS